MNLGLLKRDVTVWLSIGAIIIATLVWLRTGGPRSTVWLADYRTDPTVSFVVIDTLGRTNTMRMDIGVRSDGTVVWRAHYDR